MKIGHLYLLVLWVIHIVPEAYDGIVKLEQLVLFLVKDLYIDLKYVLDILVNVSQK